MNLTNRDIEFGKIPPQAIELEEVVLGAIMLERDALIGIIDIIKPESFYKSEHQFIYEAVLNLFKNDKAIDILTVTEQLRKNKKLEEVGGALYVTQLTSRVASAAHLNFHARIVQDKFILRELIRIGSEIQNRAFDDETEIKELISYSESELFNLIINKNNVSRKIIDIAKERINELEEISKSKNKYTGVISGFNKIDNITSGWQKADLIIVAARPSAGKTTLALEFAINAAEHSFPVDIYSLEMKDKQLFDKVLSRKTHLENSFLRTNKLQDIHWEKINFALGKIDKLPMYVDDTPSLNILDFRAKAKRNKIKYDTQLIIVDYLQLMKSPEDYKKGGREREVAGITEQLKATAKELDIPVIALSQMNRSVENRSGSKRPQLSDLRESGAIEQDADLVIFIHRPEYYGIIEDSENNSTKNLIEIIIAKHRNGVTGDLSIWKNDNWTDFFEYKDQPIAPNYYEKEEPF